MSACLDAASTSTLNREIPPIKAARAQTHRQRRDRRSEIGSGERNGHKKRVQDDSKVAISGPILHTGDGKVRVPHGD